MCTLHRNFNGLFDGISVWKYKISRFCCIKLVGLHMNVHAKAVKRQTIPCITVTYIVCIKMLTCLYLAPVCLQGEALGFSLWRGNEVHLCKVLRLSAAAEGERFYCLNTTSGVRLKVPGGTSKVFQILFKCPHDWTGAGFSCGHATILSMREERGYFLSKTGAPLSIKYIYYLFSYTTVVCERHTLHCWFIYFLFFFWQSWNHVALCVKQLFIQKLKATFFRLFKLPSERKWLLLTAFFFFFFFCVERNVTLHLINCGSCAFLATWESVMYVNYVGADFKSLFRTCAFQMSVQFSSTLADAFARAYTRIHSPESSNFSFFSAKQLNVPHIFQHPLNSFRTSPRSLFTLRFVALMQGSSVMECKFS